MSLFRCSECRQLQFKYHLQGKKLEIEVKCYNCNNYSYFTIWLDNLNKNINTQNEDEKNNK